MRAPWRCEEPRATCSPGALIKGALKIACGHCHLFEMEISGKWHFPSVCYCSHPSLPASLEPCTGTHPIPCRVLGPTRSVAHTGPCDDDGGLQTHLNLAEACRLVQAVPGLEPRFLDTPDTLGSLIPPFLAGKDVSPASGLLGSKSASNTTTPSLPLHTVHRPPCSPATASPLRRPGCAGAVPGTQETQYTLVE